MVGRESGLSLLIHRIITHNKSRCVRMGVVYRGWWRGAGSVGWGCILGYVGFVRIVSLGWKFCVGMRPASGCDVGWA